MFLMPGSRARPRNDRHVVRIKVQTFVTAGTTTYFPSRGLIEAIVETVGAGAGGGGATGSATGDFGAGGGGSGSYARKYLTAAQIGQSQTVTIGAGGTGATAGTNTGSSGGDTSFGTLCIGKGGSGGLGASAASVPTGGVGGVAGTGDFTPVGNTGGSGFYNNASTQNIIGQGCSYGAPSVFGGGVSAVSASVVSAQNYGAGGAGAYLHETSATSSGGAGSGGACIVTEFLAV